MTIYDPPSDPFGNIKTCPFCDAELAYEPWTKEYFCDNPDCPQKDQE